jgi:hypothetical protein
LLPFSDDMKTQQQNRQMIARARAELHEGVGPMDNMAAQSRGATDELMRELIPRIEEQNKLLAEQNRLMTEDAKRGVPGAPGRVPGAPGRTPPVLVIPPALTNPSSPMMRGGG